jgi:hypothetical protein
MDRAAANKNTYLAVFRGTNRRTGVYPFVFRPIITLIQTDVFSPGNFARTNLGGSFPVYEYRLDPIDSDPLRY